VLAALTLNPCIDKTIYIDNFVYGGMNRTVESRIDPAGKGINVAMAYRNLGGDVYCTGFNYDEGGRHIADLLDKSGIRHDFINVNGKLRTNLKIFDLSKRVVTEINESGYPVTEDDLSELLKRITRLKSGVSTFALCGSVPKGVPDSIYAQIISLLKSLSIRCVLDAEGELLCKGSKAQPFLIKPNLDELESVSGIKLQSTSEIIRAARKFIDMGVSIAAVSLGENGALLIDETQVFSAPAIQVEVKGTAGAGDSMIAGFCLAIENSLPADDMLRYGMAAAAASCMNEGTILCKKDDFEALLCKVEVRKVIG
jgi:1-phosphofructokinase